ncbi:methyltransferase [Streptomonospora litoralis]|uniref:Carminomycin 4-O-methyltransferase n=1 Tax=Streptomonospora litoralis TaxID=2498135 RepID=A0A4V0ZJT0_9ACTN|nr:methyltransferase [Streptomonospora litoralis]QBI54552.1 Carminomycin 4-O-methyltransferase [Streptomonospora litoralis]
MAGREEAESRELLRLMVGPWLAEAVAAAVRLGVVDRLGAGPAGAGELAGALDLDPESLGRLLRLLTALGLLEEERPDRFRLAPTGELLHSDHPSSMRDLALLYRSDFFISAWRGLSEAVRTGEQAFAAVHGRDVYTYLDEHPGDAGLFDAGMAVGGSFAEGLPDAYDFAAESRVADIGGGDGSLLAELLRRHPRMHGLLQERPQVLAGARERLAPYVDEGRCTLLDGDFRDSVPAEADVYLLCRVLHNWDDDSCARILANCAAAMSPRSRLLIVERIIPDGRHPWLSRAFDVHMMVMTSGRERTAGEYEALLRPVGLRTQELRELSAEMRVLVAAPV